MTAKEVRFSTLTAICDVLESRPGDVVSVAHPGRTRRCTNRCPDRELSGPGQIRYAFVTGWTVDRLPSPLGSPG